MAVHENFQDLAVSLITKNGRSIIIRRTTRGEDGSEPWKTGAEGGGAADTVQNVNTVGVFFEDDQGDLLVSLSQAIGRGEQSPGNISAEGIVCWVPAKGLPIDIADSDVVVDGDKVWKIRRVRLIQPGPTPVVYELRLES